MKELSKFQCSDVRISRGPESLGETRIVTLASPHNGDDFQAIAFR